MFLRKKISHLIILLLLFVFSNSLSGCGKQPPLPVLYKDAGNWTLPIVYNPEDKGVTEVELNKLFQDPRVKYVLIFNWATWNEPDNIELSYIEDLYKIYKDKGLVVLGVSIDSSENLQWDIINQVRGMKKIDGTPADITYPILWDMKSSLMEKYQIDVVPTRLLIDRSNKIIYGNAGFSVASIKDLSNKVKELLP